MTSEQMTIILWHGDYLKYLVINRRLHVSRRNSDCGCQYKSTYGLQQEHGTNGLVPSPPYQTTGMRTPNSPNSGIQDSEVD